MKKLILFALILFSGKLFAFIEIPKAKDALEFKKRILIVQLMDANSRYMKATKVSEEDKNEHLATIGESNILMKAAFSEYWKQNKTIIFLNQNGIDSLFQKSDPSKYALIVGHYGTKTVGGMGKIAKEDGYLFSAYLADKKNEIFEMALPNGYLSDYEYRFVVHNMQKSLVAGAQDKTLKDIWMADKNNSVLSKKPLYVYHEQSDLEEADAKALYENKLFFVSEDELEEKIRNKENIIFTAVIMDMRNATWLFATIDAATMDVLSIATRTKIAFAIRTGTSRGSSNNFGSPNNFGSSATTIDFNRVRTYRRIYPKNMNLSKNFYKTAGKTGKLSLL